MPHTYPHRPDVEFLTRERARSDRSISLVRRTVDEGRADAGVFNAGVDDCRDAAVLAWLFEEPQETIDGYLRRGVELAGHARRVLAPPYGWGSVIGWLRIALLCGDEHATELMARTALDPSVNEPTSSTAAAAPLVPLAAALTVRDQDAAAGLLADLGARTALDSTPADQLRRLHGLPRAATAILAGDQAALDATCVERSAANARYWSRSAENRRHVFALLDPEASLLVATAPRYGLSIPDVPDLPRGLMPGPHRTTP